MELKKLILKYALLNAVKHGGRANPKAVLGKVLAERPELRTKARELLKEVTRVCEQVSSMGMNSQLKELKKEFPEALKERKPARKEEKATLPPLPNVKKYKVVRTRFAPNPDSVLHLGSARAIILSHDYARMYNGRFILRFEDTDPRLKKADLVFYEYIKEDLEWLGCRWDEEYIQSDRLEIYYKVAEELIRRGGAYVCTCKPERFRELISKSLPCPCRSLPIEEHLHRWEAMLDSTYAEGQAVLRVKTDLNHPNPAVRDWPAMRIVDTGKHPHPRVGSKYRVWPLYNMAAGVDDHYMGITHIIRGQEHFVNTVRQRYLYAHMGWEYPETIHYGRLMIQGGVLSKSKIEKGIKEGLYKGYDDPKLATLRALRRRGIRPEAIRRLIYAVGPKPSDVVVSWENLLAYNRQIIDPIANRYFAVFDPVRLVVKGLKDGRLEVNLERHPEDRNRPKRRFVLDVKDGRLILLVERADVEKAKGMVRLIGLMNIKNLRLRDGEVLAEFDSFELEKAKKARASAMHWLPIEGNVEVRVIIEDPDRPMTGLGEAGLMEEEVDASIQLERHFFARVDGKGDGWVRLYYTSK